MVIILYIIVGFMCLVLPLVLTTINIINLFKRKKRIKENLVDILTFVLGIILTVILYIIHGFKDYNEALTLGGRRNKCTCSNCIMEYANCNCNPSNRNNFIHTS